MLGGLMNFGIPIEEILGKLDFRGGLGDPLRIFGFKKYPPGGQLYNMFLDLGFNVDLDALGGTKQAWEIYKQLRDGEVNPLLVPFYGGKLETGGGSDSGGIDIGGIEGNTKPPTNEPGSPIPFVMVAVVGFMVYRLILKK